MRVTGAICEYKVSFAFARVSTKSLLHASVSTKSLFTCPVSLIRGLVNIASLHCQSVRSSQRRRTISDEIELATGQSVQIT